MNPGSAVIGFLILAGLVTQFGWPAAAIIGVPLLFDLLIGRGIQSSRNFRYLDPLEQALRRASQGFALMVFVPLAAVVPYVWLYGWPEFLALWPRLAAHPADAWPFALLAAAFVANFVRFRVGVLMSAGARDRMRGPKGLLKCAAGLVIVGYLTFSYPAWGALPYDAERWPFFLVVVAAYAAGLWCVLVGGVRFLLLAWPRQWAFVLVDRYNRNSEFSWDASARRRRWFFRGRRQ